MLNESEYRIDDFTFDSPKGGRVTSYWVAPAKTSKNPGILFGHWGYGNKTEFLSEAILYAKTGHVSLLIDYPWARPDPWRKNINNFHEPIKDLMLYSQAVIDLKRGIDLLCSSSNVNSGCVAYIGHSYGAQWGAILSAIDRRIKAAVLIGGIPSVSSIYLESHEPSIKELRKSLGEKKMKAYLDVVGILDAIRYIPFASPTPLLFQFAKFETLFTEKAMCEYYRAAKDPKAIKWYNTGHELNSIWTLIDRMDWLEDTAGIRSAKPLILKFLKDHIERMKGGQRIA